MSTHLFPLNGPAKLRLDVISSRCVRVRLDSPNEPLSESGLTRYGILKPTPQGNPTCHDSGSFTLENYDFNITPDAQITISKNGREIVKISEFGTREKGGFKIVFGLNDDERIYGLGDENRERLQKRGHRAEMILRNVASYIPIPYFMSSNGWSTLVNSTCYHIIDVDSKHDNTILVECAYGQPDIYLFLADKMTGLLGEYTALSGRPALLPRWAYGFTFVCDEREVRARDVLYEALEFRRQKLPCDVIGLEPDWMEKHYDYSVDKKWSEKRFHVPFWLKPNGNGTFAGTLHKMGFRLSLWLCTDYDFSEYEEQLLKDPNEAEKPEAPKTERSADDLIQDPHFAGAIRSDTITKPGEPWFKHLEKFVDHGADAFKLDGSNQVNFHPDRKWFNGMEDWEMHNLYPMLYNKQMANGFINHTGRRPMIYSAGGYAGIQQYSATWTGDTGGGAKPLAGLLNLALSGHSNGTCDMQIWDRQGIHSGFLLPWSQLLGWHMYTQPWFQGPDILEAFAFYAKLRYRLLQYIYTAAWAANHTGIPMMRPMPLAFPNDRKCDNIINQYMLGDALLVASFTNSIYLPAGQWINYWTKKTYAGGQTIAVENIADWAKGKFPVGGPLFVKCGSLIPTAPEMLFSNEKPLDCVAWEEYPDEKGCAEGYLYEDDGTTFEYRDGAYSLIHASVKDGQLFTKSVKNNYDGIPENRTHLLESFN
jgi:alpha-glucosidase